MSQVDDNIIGSEHVDDIEVFTNAGKNLEISEGTREHAELVTTGRHHNTRDALQWLTYAHLPLQLQQYSAPFYHAAVALLEKIAYDSPELFVSINKLIEAKDSAVRAGIRNDHGRAGSVSRPQTVVDPPRLNAEVIGDVKWSVTHDSRPSKLTAQLVVGLHAARKRARLLGLSDDDLRVLCSDDTLLYDEDAVVETTEEPRKTVYELVSDAASGVATRRMQAALELTTVVSSAEDADVLYQEHDRLAPTHVKHMMYGGSWFCGGYDDHGTCGIEVQVMKLDSES